MNNPRARFILYAALFWAVVVGGYQLVMWVVGLAIE